MLDLFALLALIAELDAAGRVATDLPAGHPAVAEGFRDDHVLVHIAICWPTNAGQILKCQ